MPTLYVTEPGARVEKEYGRFLVTKDDEVLLAVPAVRVQQVVLVGSVGVTTQALIALLNAGVGLTLISAAGKLLGRLLPGEALHIPLRHAQYQRAADPAFCLLVSRAYVRGKLCNCRTLARRWARTNAQVDVRQIERITQCLRRLPMAGDLATVRGLEGEASKAYFAVLRQVLRPGLGFDKRVRRPPTDPVNALLSLGYTFLTDNLMAACEIVGLDPYDGFFHADKYGRPALALDLMEEFRALVVDSVVLNVVNRGMLAADDFHPGPEGGLYLKPAALREFCRQYSARLNTEIVHPGVGRSLSYQKCFEVQARALRQVIEGRRTAYIPFIAERRSRMNGAVAGGSHPGDGQGAS